MGGWFAETVAVTAALAALGLVAGRSRRIPAEARHALWAVVLIRFLLPPTVAWPWATGWQPLPPPGVVRVSGNPIEPVAPPADPIIPADRPELPADPFHRDAPPADPEPVPVPAGGTFRSNPPPWVGLALLAWVGGSIAVAARGAVRVIRFRRALRRAVPAPTWLGDEIAAVGLRLGIQPPSAVVLDDAGGPILWCLGRPRLVLPDGLERMPAGSRAALLAHELAHLARGDHWAARLDLLAGLAWWWNPVCRLARRRLRAEAEAACDARVVRAYPEHRLAYAEALVSVSERLSRLVPPRPALGLGAAGAARNLEARLTMILRDPIRSPSRWLPAVAPALLALTLPSWTRGQQPDPPADPARAAVIEAKPQTGLDEPPRADRPDPTTPAAPPAARRPGGAEVAAATSRPAEDGASGPLPPAARARLLQIRRDAQAAAVARAQARRDMAAATVRRQVALNKRIPNTVSREEIQKAEGEFLVADAELDGEQAKLAEADLFLDPDQASAEAQPRTTRPPARRTAPAAAPLDPAAADDRPRPPATLADWRDQADLAVLQLEGKHAELQRAETRVGRARITLDNAQKLFKKGVVSSNEVAIPQNELQQAEDEARIQGIEVRQAELRLKQARRRAEAEEARLRRAAGAARAEVESTRSSSDRAAARDRLDDLMFQLDPDHKPAVQGTPPFQTHGGLGP